MAFHYKFHVDGTLYEAKLVANGRNQLPGMDCDETFNPTIKLEMIHTIISLETSR